MISALKTNENDNPSTDIMSGFADKLRNGKESDIPNIISEYMDINKVLSLVVVDRAIRHDDGFALIIVNKMTVLVIIFIGTKSQIIRK